MRKTLFTGFAAVSLLICIAVIVLWIRSYWYLEGLEHIENGQDVLLFSMSGRIGYEFQFRPSDPNVPLRFISQMRPSTTTAMHWFYFENNGKFFVVLMPSWLLVVLASILPITWAVRFLRHRKYAPGLCPKCGYDLRASSDRCPECGTAIQRQRHEGTKEHEVQHEET